jgi:hypothetical protein
LGSRRAARLFHFPNMSRFLHAALFIIAFIGARAAEFAPLPSPAAPGAMGSSLATGPDGGIWLSWLEPRGDEGWALRFSRLDAVQDRWSDPRTIAEGEDWFANWADFPALTILSARDMLAVWSINNPPAPHSAHGAGHHGEGYHAEYSLSHDAGATWTKAQAITGESATTEFVAALALGENSRALAAWLDGRARATNGEVQQLYAQTLLANGRDALVDPSVCDCCQLSLVRVPNGALLAYRGRTTEEVRDIRLARWRDGTWEKPHPLHADGWKIAACPVNGPRLAADGERVAVVWFTGAQNDSRVQAKLSQDAGETFGPAQRIDLGRPSGRVDAVMLPDGTAAITWLELPARDGSRPGGIFLRTLAPDGTPGEPQLLAASTAARAAGFPRLVRLSDGRLLLSYTVDEKPTRLATLLVTLK